MSGSALSGVRVIDLTHYIAGPYCTKLMAGYGAEVIKIERPGSGDGLRSVGPFYKDEPGVERSIPFLWLNTGKKSITLNLKSVQGRDLLKRLVKDADILVENFTPGVMSGLGLSYETLREINPRLVMTSISNFGQTGPYRDYKATEIVEYALNGGMYMTGGDPEKPPLATGPAVCQYTAAQHAYVATLMALFKCGATGQGQHVDVSIQEASIENIEMTLMNYLRMKKNARRGKHIMAPWTLYSCADGYCAVISGPFRHWLGGAELFQDPRLLDDKYYHARDRMKYRDEYEELLQPWIRVNTREDIFHAGQEKRLAFGYLATMEEAMELTQHRYRKYFKEVDHPVVGTHKYCDEPFKAAGTPWLTERAPLLGEYNGYVYGELLGMNEVEINNIAEVEGG